MRDTLTKGDTSIKRRLLCTVAAMAIGTLLSAAPVLANDDDEPVREEGLIAGIMRGLGGAGDENGINYRERSPLVVPKNLALPPPQTRKSEAANWPKDPDVLARRAAREALKKRDKSKEQDPVYSERIQPEPDLGRARAHTATVSPQPGVGSERWIINESNGLLTPEQLGVKAGGLFDVFKTKRDDGSNVPFKGEPTRESLTMPPPGYQTPASTQAYGISEQEKYKLLGGQPPGAENPSGILPPGKF